MDIYVDITDEGFEVVDSVIHKVDGEKVCEAAAEMKGSDHDDKGSKKGSGY